MWKEMVVAIFKVLSLYLPGGTGKNQLGRMMSQLIFERDASRIKV
jgi:hypothetical protein